uniref:Uncharacterized protein n=1 Tax=Micrurus spixii TaxID=129469 RepID=A0A2D4LEJ7_9SAUR
MHQCLCKSIQSKHFKTANISIAVENTQEQYKEGKTNEQLIRISEERNHDNTCLMSIHPLFLIHRGSTSSFGWAVKRNVLELNAFTLSHFNRGLEFCNLLPPLGTLAGVGG